MITVEQMREVFMNTPLEEDYNLLEEDLMKLANAFAAIHHEEMVEQTKEAVYLAVRKETRRCVEFVSSLNPDVGNALAFTKHGL